MIVYLVPMLFAVAIITGAMVYVMNPPHVKPKLAKSMAQDISAHTGPTPVAQYESADQILRLSLQTSDIPTRLALQKRAYQHCQNGVALEVDKSHAPS